MHRNLWSASLLSCLPTTRARGSAQTQELQTAARTTSKWLRASRCPLCPLWVQAFGRGCHVACDGLMSDLANLRCMRMESTRDAPCNWFLEISDVQQDVQRVIRQKKQSSWPPKFRNRALMACPELGPFSDHSQWFYCIGQPQDVSLEMFWCKNFFSGLRVFYQH